MRSQQTYATQEYTAYIIMDELADDTIRSFVAIELPDSVKRGIGEIEKTLKAYDETDIVRWVEPELTHITLHFLGDVEVLRLPQLKAALSDAAQTLSPFSTETAMLGAFPNVHRPSVLWVGVDRNTEEQFQQVKSAVSEAVASFGDAEDRHDFIPHITLGRVSRRASNREKKGLGKLVGPTDIPTGFSFDVDGVTLFRSRLTPDGPIYSQLSYHEFGTTS